MKLLKGNKIIKVTNSCTEEEGLEIGNKLLDFCEQNRLYGVSANQVGINKRVFVVNIIEPIIFVEPQIEEKSEEKFTILESCPSYPGKLSEVVRHSNITVSCLNFKNSISFGKDSKRQEPIVIKEEPTKESDKELWECSMIQRCIEYLNGNKSVETVNTRTIRRETPKIKRNDKVLIKKIGEEETQYVKYKKAIPLVNTKEWELI